MVRIAHFLATALYNSVLDRPQVSLSSDETQELSLKQLAALFRPHTVKAGIEASDGVHEGTGVPETWGGLEAWVGAFVKNERSLARITHMNSDDPSEKEVVIAAGVYRLKLALYRCQSTRRERSACAAVSVVEGVNGGETAGAFGGGEEPAQALLIGGKKVNGVVALLSDALVEPCTFMDADEKEQRI
jgi:hypothetical protein